MPYGLEQENGRISRKNCQTTQGGIHRIRLGESKIIKIAPDELNYALGREAGLAVDQETLRQQLARPDDDFERMLARLTCRDLIEAVDGRYRFQVELIRRWFAQLSQVCSKLAGFWFASRKI